MNESSRGILPSPGERRAFPGSSEARNSPTLRHAEREGSAIGFSESPGASSRATRPIIRPAAAPSRAKADPGQGCNVRRFRFHRTRTLFACEVGPYGQSQLNTRVMTYSAAFRYRRNSIALGW